MAVAVALPVVVLLPIPAAVAGKYTVLTCPGDAGWSQNPPTGLFMVYSDGCAGGAASGLSMAMGPNADGNYATNSSASITFSVPAGFSISSYFMRLLADGGPCSVQSNQCASGFGNVWVNHTGQSDPDYDYRNLGYGSQTAEIAPTGLSGVDWVTVGVGCDGGPGNHECPGAQGGSPEALADVLSADFVIESAASPSASGIAGTLLEPAAHGTAELQFTAADPGGPGVYSVTADIDGAAVYSGIPDGNEGACAAAGTYTDGSWEFEHLQPCKQGEAVDIPVNTTVLSDGAHTLKVIVTDAAQNSSVVYDGTITTANRTTVSSLLASPVTSSPGEEPTYVIVLDKHTTSLGKEIKRAYGDSALSLSGQLRNPAGTPAPGVAISLVAQNGNEPAGPPIVLAHTTSNAAGEWVLRAPAGPSRQLRIMYGANPASSTQSAVTLKELVRPSLGLHVATPGGVRIVFSGHLAISPIGSPRPLVVIETPAGHGEWETVGHAVRVGADGSYRYVFHSSPLTLERRFAFRAYTPATNLWQAGTSPTRTAVVH